ncbi:UDP-N-acetylmuramate dehydrogenase [Prochlorococcus marinus]|uniref:UDP-N-acetylenolpyruvoylglucosamine reductase n=1 Tax=Prochlorococcus marinus XMU1408 TaxID=2213228 RepID=A0A318R5G1_PROMR|nr:UDP-N-acetylmuramate dehydrogenase [Prochlorococcus marinus]MBW3042583.1 UDP-N-acetylenolpyruvoylglucosamine reductase [Prochlorococcus marinus str. XMU1408]PYE03629.1 UDP-N-acetylenolpyruvoylglucosamine reductase [Prochlorococcus marinus XMU1408]
MNSIELKKNISLSNFTTWRIGGPAEWIAQPKNNEEIKYLINWINKKKIPCNIIGAGSNLLINDEGIKGLSLCMRKLKGIQIDKNTGNIEVLSGEMLPTLARKAAANGLHGLEWAVGIPGTIGGAIVMNAGAQGNCISDYLESITTLSLKGEYKIIESADLNFGYRYSLLQEENLIVVSAKLKLESGHEESKIRQITNENFNHRLRTQPYQDQSCGSVFRNPEPLKAAKLIEELGLKGFRFGGAEISKIHSNFIINANKASSHDVRKLIKHIQEKVFDSYGILLETEVKQCGFEI